MLPHDSYTSNRLRNSTPDHLHVTSRRCFIGPIPQGWLNSHRRDWYKRHLHIHYSSRTATFSANANIGRYRRLTGLEGPSASAAFAHSFPQPSNLEVQSEEDPEREGHQSVTTCDPPAVTIPRASHPIDPSTPGQIPPGAPNPQYLSPPTDDSPCLQPFERSRSSRKTSTTSFHTADEELSHGLSPRLSAVPESSLGGTLGQDESLSNDQTEDQAQTNEITDTSSRAVSSTASLLKHRSVEEPKPTMRPPNAANGAASESLTSIKPQHTNEPLPEPQPSSDAGGPRRQKDKTEHRGSVRFAVPEDDLRKAQHVKARLAQMRRRDTIKRIGKGQIKDGHVVKMENMLVRVEFTAHEMPLEFTENESEKIEPKTIDKWKEFMVVCRESDDDKTPFLLEMYRTRVIPAVEKQHTKKRWTHEIPLNRQTCKINLYSSLDKTIVLWVPSRKGNLIYIMQARSGANSMEWYTFLRHILGFGRSSMLQINVPDLAVNLRIESPFETLESAQDLAKAAEGDEEAMVKTMEAEQIAAANIVQRCMDMLEQSDFQDTVQSWAGSLRPGLAWKRYDRLEWVHGANEKKMYGTIGMEESHELELRPKQHYPTTTQLIKKEKKVEPPPVEGFLIRLTSQRGTGKRFGKMFFKRLYFSTHNHFLIFSRPSKADPPPPPKLPMRQDSSTPSSHEISEQIPIIYSVNPFPVRDGQVEWMSRSNLERTKCDRDAEDESARRNRLVLDCDGVVNLSSIRNVRNTKIGALDEDDSVGGGPDVDFNREVPDTQQDDGTTTEFDDQRAFELVLKNGLIIRLQAYDKITKREWISRLRDLVDYWQCRSEADINLYKTVRRQNLGRLAVDEDAEALIGQFARKWEVLGAFASSELYNMCGISCCRSIHISGTLWRRSRMRGAFERNLVILSHGRLLIFQDALRARDGRLVRQIHQERVASLDLSECYIYSGLITSHDLLFQSQSADRSHPGRHALPRMFIEDGWSSTDEDTMTCFVIWHGKRSSWFQSQGVEEDGRTKRRIKKVRSLGKEGRGTVFKCRSRAERDHWVMSVGIEIEKLAVAEDVRIVSEGETG